MPAERGTLSLGVGFEADQPGLAMQKTQELAGRLDTALSALRPGPVSWYSLDAPTVSVWRPYNDQGRLSPPRYRASAEVGAMFSDFVALSDFVATWGEEIGITVSSVDWTLSDETRDRASAETLAAAVLDARTRATTIAHALEVELGQCVEVADPGLLSTAGPDLNSDVSMQSGHFLAASQPATGVELHPETIVVEATVHARFQTS